MVLKNIRPGLDPAPLEGVRQKQYLIRKLTKINFNFSEELLSIALLSFHCRPDNI